MSEDTMDDTTASAALRRAEEARTAAERERDELAWALLEAENQIATLVQQSGTTAPADLELMTLHQVIANLRHESEALRASTSWRLTRPLRALSDLVHGRRS